MDGIPRPPRAVIPPPTREGSDAIPPRLAPRSNSLRAQKEKKEERALGIEIEKETNMKRRRTAGQRGLDGVVGDVQLN